MGLTEQDKAIDHAIAHFEALQKRYTRQHNGTACEHVKLALEGLRRIGPEIVRCRDCAHHEPIPLDKEETYYADRVFVCKNGRGDYDTSDGFSVTWADGFCDEGKRMDADAPERAGKDGRDG